MKIAARLGIACIVALSAAGSLSAADLLDGVYIAGREYVVTVSPVDEESRDAENADLYERRVDEEQWRNLGLSEKMTLPDGEVRFLKLVEADRDGVYHYTSRPVVGGEASSPPGPSSPTQAVVVVDTVPPRVRITRPVDPARATAGESLDIAWVILDENLDDFPAALQWSLGEGENWRHLADNLLPAGEMVWAVPAGASGRITLRLEAADKAGNRGTGLRQVGVAIGRGGAPVAAAPLEEDCLAECPRYDKDGSWPHYLMGVDLMRRNLPLEALPYYWRSVREDPDFIDAWADIGLAYIGAGSYKTAREVTLTTMRKATGRVDLRHLMGESFQAEGMERLARAVDDEEQGRARELTDAAKGWYRRAIRAASEGSRPEEGAASLFRLGEISYFVEKDAAAARGYWREVLDLPDPVAPAASSGVDESDLRRRRADRMRVIVDAWREWARGYLERLDALEKAGRGGLMPEMRVGPQRAVIGLEDLLPSSPVEASPKFYTVPAM